MRQSTKAGIGLASSTSSTGACINQFIPID